ncbi:MAG TPA: cyanophycin synthetase, partial [Terrimesophilobacter sp.]|nr:cyanophycin synthetase [Terrimesophilobacter sp.]
GIACDRAFVEDRHNTALEIATIEELTALGLGAPHTVTNILAATALARSYGIPMSAVSTALQGFRADHHRTEIVATAAGVTWVDDSKATNPHAARAALRAFPSVVWIAGGLLKGIDPEELVADVAGRLRGVILLGRDRDALRAAIVRHAPELPLFEVQETDTEGVMPSAVRFAAELAVQGDTVLLAPAAASMDQFRDYADRGRRFQAAVRDLVGVEADDDKPSASP